MSAGSSTDDVVVGVVGRPWGVKGQFLLDPRGSAPSFLLERGSLRLRRAGAPLGEFKLLDSHQAGGRLVVKIEGCGSVEQAEALRGAEAVVASDAFDPPQPGSFYPHQLVGLEVFRIGGDPVGTVVEILRTGGPEVLVVKSGTKDLLVPFAAEICRHVDLAAGRIEIDPPPGLLELE